MDMAPNSNESNLNGFNIVAQLQEVLRLRTPEDGSNVSSGCSSPGTPATPSPLTKKLQSVLHTGQNGRLQRPSGRQLASTSEHGLLATGVSPSRTNSSTSDSSICGVTNGYFSPDSNSKEADRNILPSGNHDLSLKVAPPGDTKGCGASSSQMDSIGDAKDSPSSNATSVEEQLVKPDLATKAGGANKGAGGSAAGAGAGTTATAPPKRKRKRKSKKPPTHLVEATPSEFRAKVQELTGMKLQPINVVDRDPPEAFVHRQPSHSKPSVELVRPQPKRPRMDMGMDIQSAAQVRSSGTLMNKDPSSVEPLISTDVKPSLIPAPAVYEAPLQIASHPTLPDTNCLSMGHSELNCTFGYESSPLAQVLLMSMSEEELNDPAASKSSLPCDYSKAADSGINASMSSSTYVPFISQADPFSIFGQPIRDSLMDFGASPEGLEDADGDQDEENTDVDQYLLFSEVPFVSR